MQTGLQQLFQTREDVLILAASGTGAMEAAVVNTTSPGDRVLVVNGGKFGERWGKIAVAYGLTVIEIKVEWGRAVDPAAVPRRLRSCSHGNPGRHTMQPGPEPTRVADRASLLDQDQERRLERVLGVVGVAQHAPADVQHERPVPGDQGGERGLVPAGEELAQQGGVARPVRFGPGAARKRACTTGTSPAAYRCSRPCPT